MWSLRLFSFVFGLGFFVTSHLCAEDAKRVRVRDLKTPCGVYLSNVASPSLGIKVAELSPGSIKAFFDSRPDLNNSQIFVVGVSLTGKDRREFVQMTKSELKAHENPKIRVRAITQPKNLTERALMQLPLVEDWQKPTLGELIPGAIFYSISNGTFTFVMLATQPPEVAVPVAVVNGLQSAATTFPRQTVGNWLSRSPTFAEKLTKQLGLSFIFTLGLTLAKAYGLHGIEDGVIPVLGFMGLTHFLVDHWSQMAFQTGWRVPVESGIPEWVNQKTRNNEEKKGRAWGTFYRQLATNIATPFWGFSTVAGPESTLFNFGFGWNWGHVVMAGIGAVATVGYIFPKMYDGPVAVVDWAKEYLSREQSPGQTLEKIDADVR